MLDAVSSQTLLQSDGAAYCVCGLIEGGEDTVAGPVHNFPVVLADDLLHEAIVPFENMAPGLIADGRQQRRRIADVGEHERPRHRVGRQGRSLGPPLSELLTKRLHFWRWPDSDLLFQATGELGVGLERFGLVATSGEGEHEVPITTLAQRLALDERTSGAFGRDQLVATEAEPGGGDALECSQFDVAQATPLGVDPGSAGARQERSSGRVQGNARRRPRGRPIPTRDGGFGSVDRFGGRLGVDESIAPEPELHIRSQFQVVPEDPPQPPEETGYVMVSIGGRLLGPERSDQFRRFGRRQPVDYEVREQDAVFASCQVLVDAATVQDRSQAAAELNPVGPRVRCFIVCHGDVP